MLYRAAVDSSDALAEAASAAMPKATLPIFAHNGTRQRNAPELTADSILKWAPVAMCSADPAVELRVLPVYAVQKRINAYARWWVSAPGTHMTYVGRITFRWMLASSMR